MNENNELNNVTPIEPVAPVEPTTEPVAETPVEPTAPEVPVAPSEPVAPVTPIEEASPAQPEVNSVNEAIAQPVETTSTEQPKTEVKEEKKSSCLPIVIIVIVLMILAVVGVVVGIIMMNNKGTSGGSASNDTTTTTTEAIDDDDYLSKIDFDKVKVTYFENQLSSNIELVKISAYSNYIYIALINKNDKIIEMQATFRFYNGDDFVESYRESDLVAEPNTIYVLDQHVKINEPYDRVTVEIMGSESIIAKKYKSVDNYTYTKKNETDKTAQEFGDFTNNSTIDTVFVKAACLRYKGDKLVFVEPGYINYVKPNETVPCTCFAEALPPKYDFDRTECVISSAQVEIE